MKNKNKQKGITLIALIITIIILLILAGISIKALTNTGLFGKANEAKIRTEISRIEEEANLIYTSKLMDNYLSDVSMSDIVSQLQAEGYEIYSVSSDGSAITGITLDNNSLSISKGETAEIVVTYEGSSEENQYYAVIKGNYYLMTKTSNGIQISKEASNVDGSSSSDTLTITSSNTLFTATINDNVITITSGSATGSEDLVVTYGSYSKTCAISIVEPPIDATEIADNATEFYGQLVENYGVTYDATDGATNAWRIFYSDGTNIYLIADDYIHYDYAPKSANYTMYKNGTDYKLSFNNVYNDYTGSASIDSNFASKWLSSYWKNNSTSTNTNIRAVAYMLDTSIWNPTFRNSDYADYAIGGPTLEMYCASYKDTHPSKYIECEAESNTYGYKVRWKDGSYGASISGLAKSNDCNNIYIISDATKAYAMWLASPEGGNALYVMGANCDGRVYNDFYGSIAPGLRPLVCLSSDIQLEKLENGNYKIVKTTE